MATQAGDLNVTLKLDIRPYAEGIKTALAIGKQFELQSQKLFQLKTGSVDVSKIDAELKKLDASLKSYAITGDKATGTQHTFNDELGRTITINQNITKTVGESAAQVSIAGAAFTYLGQNASRVFHQLMQEATDYHKTISNIKFTAEAQGLDPRETIDTVRNLDAVRNGLISLEAASTSYRNVLNTGLGLNEATTVLRSFIDAAVVGKDQTQSLDDALISTTKSLKENGDTGFKNIGYQKSLAEVYKQVGLSQKDLNQDINNGTINSKAYAVILNDLAKYQGKAAELSNSFAGEQAKLDVATESLRVSVGTGLQMALIEYLGVAEKILPITDASGNSFWSLSNIVKQLTQGAIGPAVVQFKLLSSTITGLADGFNNFIDNVETGIPLLDDTLDLIRKITNKSAQGSTRTFTPIESDTQSEDIQYDSYGNPIAPIKRYTEGHANEILAEGGDESKEKRTRSSSRKPKDEKERLTLLQQIDEEIKQINEDLLLNKGIIGAEYELQHKLLIATARRRELTGEALKDVKSQVGVLKTEREEIEKVVDYLDEKNKLFEQIVKESRERVISSTEFQLASRAFNALADGIRNEFMSVWRDVFGEANSLAEQFIASLAQQFLDMALNYAVSSILSAIFPGAGIITSFFGGSPSGGAGMAGTSGMPSASGGSYSGVSQMLPGIIQRSMSNYNYSQASVRYIEQPYITETTIKGKDINLSMRRFNKVDSVRRTEE